MQNPSWQPQPKVTYTPNRLDPWAQPKKRGWTYPFKVLGVLLFLGVFGIFASDTYKYARGQSNFSAAQLYCVIVGPPVNWAPCSPANPLSVDASVSASISGFEPGAVGTPISVTTGGDTETLPAGDVVVVTNVGTTNPAYCMLGGAATTADQYISPGGGWFAFTVGAATELTCITASSTTTVNMVGGTGLPTGTGGGSGGGGGGGGAVTIADGADVAEGETANGACGTDAGTGCTLLQRLSRIAQNVTATAVTLGTYASPQTSFMSTTPMARSATLSSDDISFSGASDHTIVTRTTGTIKVHRLLLACASSVVLTIKDGASNNLTGAMTMTSMYLPFESEPHFATTSTNDFVINTGSAVQCSGRVYYLEN